MPGKWTPEQREKFKATMAEKKRLKHLKKNQRKKTKKRRKTQEAPFTDELAGKLFKGMVVETLRLCLKDELKKALKDLLTP